MGTYTREPITLHPLHPLYEKGSDHCEEQCRVRKVNRPPLCVITGIPKLYSKELMWLFENKNLVE